MGARILDPVAWRARAYFALKLPLAVAGLGVIAGCWLGGLFCLTFPAWRTLGLVGAFGSPAWPARSRFIPLGAVLLLRAPWLTHGLTEADRWLMRGLLGAGLARRADPGALSRAGPASWTIPPPGCAASSGTCTTAPRRSSWPWP